MVESTQNDVQPKAKGNTAALKNRRVESMALTGEEAGTKKHCCLEEQTA